MTIVDLLRKYDIHPIKRFGQNFLIDPNIKRKLLESLPLGQGMTFIEIGPGTGALTKQLLRKNERVIAIEIDKKLHALLEDSFSQHYSNHFTLVKGDVLDILTEEFLEGILKPPHPTSPTKGRGDKEIVLMGNLPYYISSPILFRVLELNHLVKGAFFTLQREVVDRLRAKAGTNNYGRLSASFGYFADTQKLFDISPGCFSPKPDVWSSFIKIIFKKKYQECRARDEYLKLVKVAFSQRRKQLKGLLSQNYQLKTKEAEDCIMRLKLSPKIRAEELSPAHFWKLLEYIEHHGS